jgi:hypothetical protein
MVTDYYSDDESLNIVQSVESEVLQDKIFNYRDREVILTNTYGWETKVLFDKLRVVLKVLRCNDKCYLVGQYFIRGVRSVVYNINRWYNTEVKYSQVGFFGNPVAEYTQRYINWDDMYEEDAYKDFYTNDKDFYQYEKIETFVWLPIKEVSENYKISELSEDELAFLLRDIVGEAG